MLGGRRRQLLQPRELALGRLARVLGQLGLLDLLAQLVDLGLLLVLLAQLVLDRLQLLAQEVLALGLVDLGLDLGLDLRAELRPPRARGRGSRESRRSRLATSTSSSSSCFSSVVIRSAPAIRWPSAAGSSMLATAICSSSGRYGICSMISEKVRWTLRVSASSSGARLDHVGQLGDPRHQVGLLGDERADAHPLGALDEDPQRAVGDLEHARDDAGDADVVELVGARAPRPRGRGGDHHQHPVAAEHVVDELDRALLADRQRRQRVREGDRLAQRQHRQRVGQRLARRGSRPRRRAATRRPRGPACPPSLAPDRHPAGGLAGIAQRQLDPQHPVLVGRPGLARRRRRPAARPRGGTGPTGSRPAGRRAPRSPAPAARRRSPAARPLTSIPTSLELDPGEVDLDHRPLRIAAVVDVDVGENPRLRRLT